METMATNPVELHPVPAKYAVMRQKCEQHLQQAKESPLYDRLVLPLAKRWGYSSSYVEDAFKKYNLEINDYGNDIYSGLPSRFALLLNYLLDEGWFAERLAYYERVAAPFSTIIDVGFGIPLLHLQWLKTFAVPVDLKHLLLLDKFPIAHDFAQGFIDVAEATSPTLRDVVTCDYSSVDLDKAERHLHLAPHTNGHSLVVALDCIEHARDPHAALSGLAATYAGCEFLIALPLGPIIPQHTVEFLSEDEITAFVSKASLTVESSYLVRTSWARDVIGNEDFEGSVFVRAKAT